MTQEQEIKHFLFPYASIVRLTALDRLQDNKVPTDQIIEPIEDPTDWRPLVTTCTYEE